MADQETINENVRQTVSFKREFFDKIEDRIKTGGYSSLSEYLRDTVREDLRRNQRERLDTILLEGIDSQEYSDVTDQYFDGLRKKVSNAREKARGKAKRKAGNR